MAISPPSITRKKMSSRFFGVPAAFTIILSPYIVMSSTFLPSSAPGGATAP